MLDQCSLRRIDGKYRSATVPLVAIEFDEGGAMAVRLKQLFHEEEFKRMVLMQEHTNEKHPGYFFKIINDKVLMDTTNQHQQSGMATT